jgi:hypothetical protein
MDGRSLLLIGGLINFRNIAAALYSRESIMPPSGWKQLLSDLATFRGPDRFPIAAYSEFMPPPRLYLKPYGGIDAHLFSDGDPWGWNVTEYEEALELRPGLEHIACQIVKILVHLGRSESAHGIGKVKLTDNPYWPPSLADRAGRLKHERYVILLPLSLSRTQDDKGRVRWTLFGGSEQGPARAFWKGFYSTPERELAEEQGLGFFRRLLASVYGEAFAKTPDLRKAGFRILPDDPEPVLPFWHDEQLPAWTEPYLWGPRQPLRSVKYLLTFRPFSRLPDAVQRAYLKGDLHLLPFPGSLLFWGPPTYVQLQRQLPLAMQIPLLHSIARHEAPGAIRVPQSGLLHEPQPGKPAANHLHGPVRNTFRRSHRWDRVHRDQDELAIEVREEKLLHVLFSTAPDDIGLYGKPMARNVQLWTHDFGLLLDGPSATQAQIKHAEHTVLQGGYFGYRFLYPAMRVGLHEVYWHRPLAAFLNSHTGKATVLPEAPLGYFTAYDPDYSNLERPLELWPRLLQRELHVEALHLFAHARDPRPHQTVRNVRKLFDARDRFPSGGVPCSLARQLLTLCKHHSLEDWLGSLPERAIDPERGHWLADEISRGLEPPTDISAARQDKPPESLTYEYTAKRSFEETYWKTIAQLAEGRYVNKDNADCIRDSVTLAMVPHDQRDLEALGDFLLDYYSRAARAAGMADKALVGDLPFTWRTDFEFPWMGGWQKNQRGETHERDLIVVIPGRDRHRAVIMADHYDTAYMLDHYDKDYGGNGARLAASGADDNHSATAALMLGAPVFLKLSKQGRLACDIWLIHLTGEEFPADCLGARYLTQQLVQGTLQMRLMSGGHRDLSRVQIQGLYVLDMIAHNNDRDRNVFQIAPGTGPESFWLAYQAHLATETWNASTVFWNSRPSRRNAPRFRRCLHPGCMPAVAQHPVLSGEVRVPYDPRSTLYNTDGQVFSDAGIPAVLFMENYDINRSGYHDSHDTMANIDLDYGAAVAAITIESVARAASANRGDKTASRKRGATAGRLSKRK